MLEQMNELDFGRAPLQYASKLFYHRKKEEKQSEMLDIQGGGGGGGVVPYISQLKNNNRALKFFEKKIIEPWKSCE